MYSIQSNDETKGVDNMVTKKGKVITDKDGKHLLEIDGKRQEINEKTISDSKALRSLAGKDVEVELSEGDKSFVVSIASLSEGPVRASKGLAATAAASSRAIPRIRITCYLPKIDLKDFKMTDAVRLVLAERMVKEGLISNKIAEKIAVNKI
jgi:hypothetical protein